MSWLKLTDWKSVALIQKMDSKLNYKLFINSGISLMFKPFDWSGTAPRKTFYAAFGLIFLIAIACFSMKVRFQGTNG